MLHMTKVKSFLRAVWSFARWGDISIIEHDRRQVICHACDAMRVVKTGIFCRACHCQPTAISDLRTKWRMRDLKCPKGQW
jgi:hypothetical protein